MTDEVEIQCVSDDGYESEPIDGPNAIPEVTECEFMTLDVDEALQMARSGHLNIFAFSRIRHSFLLKITWELQAEPESHVRIIVQHAAKIVDNFHVRTDADFINLLKLALKKVWLVHPCIHCDTFLFEDDSVCATCKQLTLVTYHDNECIICKESNHPILFRCVNCIDSQICVKCETKRGNMKSTCVVCRRPRSRDHISILSNGGDIRSRTRYICQDSRLH